MKTRIRNVLILLLGILVLGIIFNINQVRAEEVEEDYIKNIMDQIPDTMNIDIPEIEYEKANKIIAEKVEKILIDNGLEYKKEDNSSEPIWREIIFELENKTIKENKIKVKVNGPVLYIDGADTARMDINGQYKNVQIVYNNQKDYKIEDEKYVKNLKLQSPKYYELDISYFGEGFAEKQFETISKYYTDLVNDNSIVVKATAGAGGSEGTTMWTWESGTHIGIFKDGILYDTRVMGQEAIVPVIRVPSNIQENQLKNFVITEINKKFVDEKNDENYIAFDIKEGAKIDNVDVKNGYTVYLKVESSGYTVEDVVIVNREKPVSITDVDKETNIKLETTTAVVPEDTTLEIERITEGENYNTVIATLGNKVNKFTLYDITLKSNGVKIQPSGKVKISIPVPEGFNKEKLVVYRINEDGTKVKYDIKVETIEGKDYATFETDHFSLYTLAMEEASNGSKELDETPKTGNVDIITYTSTAIALISLAGIVVTKKNNK